jgi:hypothetical protein
MAQTTVQKSAAVRFGSAVLSIGSSFGALINIGAIRALTFNHKGETLEIPFDNTESLKFFKNGQKGSFGFQLGEIDLTTLSILEQGLVDLDTTAASLVSGATQVIPANSLVTKQFVEIANQNGDGTAPTIVSVVGATDGALTAAADDFELVLGADGKYGLVFNVDEGAALTTMNQVITITYDYTPNASKTLTFNDFGQKATYVARIVNTDSNGKTFKIDLENVTNITPLSFPFQSDTGDDVAVIELELEGSIVEIVDEQSTT